MNGTPGTPQCFTANVMGKSHEFIFREFSENFVPNGAHGGGIGISSGYESVRPTLAVSKL